MYTVRIGRNSAGKRLTKIKVLVSKTLMSVVCPKCFVVEKLWQICLPIILHGNQISRHYTKELNTTIVHVMHTCFCGKLCLKVAT